MNLSLESDPLPMRDSRKNPELSYLRILPQGTLQRTGAAVTAPASGLRLSAHHAASAPASAVAELGVVDMALLRAFHESTHAIPVDCVRFFSFIRFYVSRA